MSWDAIEAALKQLYGEQEPRHYGTIIKYALGGPDPLDGPRRGRVATLG